MAITWINAAELQAKRFPDPIPIPGTPKPIRGRVTVASELKNRNDCRYGLQGVQVLIDGIGEPVTVSSSYWNENGRLMLDLAGEYVAPAERLALVSIWPVCCCEPRRRNRYNSRNGKFVYEGDA